MQAISDKVQLAMPDEVRARLEARGIDTSPTPQRLSALRERAVSCSLCQDTGYTVGGGHMGRMLALCSCQRERRIAQYRKDSNIPAIYQTARLPDFDATLYGGAGSAQRRTAESIRAQAARYVANFDQIKADTSGRGLYLTSRTKGSGKTMLAAIIANELIDRGTRARFMGMAQMLADIKASYNKESGESEAQIIHTATNAPVLVLDDVGVERPTDWVGEIVYRLLDERLGQARPTIFTSNVPVDELRYDERITDRIRRMAFVMELPEVGVRAKLAAVEDMRMRAMLGGVV